MIVELNYEELTDIFNALCKMECEYFNNRYSRLGRINQLKLKIEQAANDSLGDSK